MDGNGCTRLGRLGHESEVVLRACEPLCDGLAVALGGLCRVSGNALSTLMHQPEAALGAGASPAQPSGQSTRGGIAYHAPSSDFRRKLEDL